MRNHTKFTIAVGLTFSSLIGCVSSGTHEEVVNQLKKTQDELASTKQSLDETETAKTQVTEEKQQVEKKADELTAELATSRTENQTLAKKVTEMGQNVENLLGEKSELRQEIEELDRMRAAAEARNQEYRKVFSKLQKMVDAGTLSIKFRGGRMLVQMSSDVVFPPGGTRIKEEAGIAIRELAQTIASFPDRKFQVIGHSDATPIKTARFPSNWELSTQRAIEVVKLLVEAGVAPEMISAAGAAEFDPVAPNETSEEKALNRRVEIVFLP
ncbi:MAG: OmpA family protein, partial [Myxococcota bacterium]